MRDWPLAGGTVPAAIITQTITAAAVAGGITTHTLGQPTGTRTLIFNTAQGGGIVIFDGDFTKAVVDDASPDTLTLRGAETILLDTNQHLNIRSYLSRAGISRQETGICGKMARFRFR